MIPAPKFLSVDDVLMLHALAIEDQGGDPTILNRGLLESAVATPRQQFGGEYLHPDIPSMAAAYAYHITLNHAFKDGNKRAGTAAMIAFLSDNGWSFDAAIDDAEPVILQLAAGNLEKHALTEWLKQHCHEKPTMELRDFFLQIEHANLLEFAKSALGSSHHTKEISTTSEEAAQAIPLIRELNSIGHNAAAVGDSETAQLVRSQCALLIILYRLAEDMGYEW